MKTFFDENFGGLNPGSIVLMMVVCFAAILCHLFDLRMDAGDLPVLMGMAVLTQGNTLQDILKWEQSNMHSREVVTVLSGQDLALGAVLGKITKSTPSSGTPAAGNTGGGTVTSVTAGPKAKLGAYTITSKVVASASPVVAAVFAVRGPDGEALPDAAIGAYANEQINFTITEGSPVIALGDHWTITVAAGSGSVRAINFDGVDGSQDAYGILTAAVDASLGAVDGVAIVRDADIVSTDLVWPVTSPVVSAEQKTAALAQLAAKGIVERTEA